MKTRPNICLHVDSTGQLWSLSSSARVKKQALENLPAGEVFVVGYAGNYGLISELHLKRTSGLDLNVHVGSWLRWPSKVLDSEFFLYEFMHLPPHRRLSSVWRLLDTELALSVAIANATRLKETDKAAHFSTRHVTKKAFDFLGITDETRICAFISSVVNPRWFQGTDNRLNEIDRFFGFQNASCSQTEDRFKLLLQLSEQLPEDSFLAAEAKKRKAKDLDLSVCYLLLHFVFRHWLAAENKFFDFDADRFFKTRKARDTYRSCFYAT
jgi:hypothetical protein